MISLLRILWSLVSRAQRREAYLVVFALFIGAFVETVGLGLILPLIGLMTQPDAILGNKYAQPLLNLLGHPSNIKMFFIVLGAVNVLFLVTALYKIWLSWYQTTYLNKLKVHTSVTLFNAYMRQPWSFFAQRHSAGLIQNVVKETDLLTQYGYASALNLARELIFMAVIGVMLLKLAPSVAVFSVLALAPLLWVFQKLSRMRIKLWADKRHQIDADRMKCVQEGLSLVREIKLAGREQDFVVKLQGLSEAVVNIERLQGVMRQLSRPVFELYAILGVSIAIIVMWRSGMSLTEIAPVLGLFALSLLRLIPSVSAILFALHGIRYMAPAMKIIADDCNRLPTPMSHPKPEPVSFGSAITFDHVHYNHAEGRKILDDVSFKIPHGGFTGIIGSTGAGKSTLIDLVLGLLAPDQGKILIDGVDVQQNLRGWQSQIGYVGQNIVMLDDTVRRNIALGIPDNEIDDQRIWQAIEGAQLTQVIDTLPEKLDTAIGERGSRISGGERQRLGIARALYNEPSILILDEATSSLDSGSEGLVMGTIERLKGRCTIVMVTHRTATLHACDLVYRVIEGKVAPENAPFIAPAAELQQNNV